MENVVTQTQQRGPFQNQSINYQPYMGRGNQNFRGNLEELLSEEEDADLTLTD